MSLRLENATNVNSDAMDTAPSERPSREPDYYESDPHTAETYADKAVHEVAAAQSSPNESLASSVWLVIEWSPRGTPEVQAICTSCRIAYDLADAHNGPLGDWLDPECPAWFVQRADVNKVLRPQ